MTMLLLQREKIAKGTIIEDGGAKIEVLEDIPVGHKIATRDIKKRQKCNTLRQSYRTCNRRYQNRFMGTCSQYKD